MLPDPEPSFLFQFLKSSESYISNAPVPTCSVTKVPLHNPSSKLTSKTSPEVSIVRTPESFALLSPCLILLLPDLLHSLHVLGDHLHLLLIWLLIFDHCLGPHQHLLALQLLPLPLQPFLGHLVLLPLLLPLPLLGVLMKRFHQVQVFLVSRKRQTKQSLLTESALTLNLQKNWHQTPVTILNLNCLSFSQLPQNLSISYNMVVILLNFGI